MNDKSKISIQRVRNDVENFYLLWVQKNVVNKNKDKIMKSSICELKL